MPSASAAAALERSGHRVAAALENLAIAALVVAGLSSVAMAAMTPEQRAAILAPTTDFSAPERFETLSGGSATNRSTSNRNAFSQPSANLSFEQRADFFVGNGLFRRNWVIAPVVDPGAPTAWGPCTTPAAARAATSRTAAGIRRPGPTTPPSRCSCAFRSRRAMTPSARSWRIIGRTSSPEPTYGGQLQDLAIPGHAPEGRMVIDYTENPVELADGEVAHLRAPSYRIADLGYGPIHPQVMLSPRVAPPMIGLGLLEAVADEDILAHADPDDADGDGISGRPNRVWSAEHGEVMLGRFGWKAGEPTLDQQSSHAMAGDVGVGNPIAPAAWGDCTAAQAACRAAPNGNSAQYDDLEAPQAVMDQILFYARNLAVPARRNVGRSDRAARQAAVLRVGLHRLPRAQARDPARLGGSRRSRAS